MKQMVHDDEYMRMRIKWQARICGNAFDALPKAGPIEGMHPLAVKIKAIRKSLGLNQTRFGEMIGVDQSSVSRWESGNFNQKPEIDNLKKIADVGNIPLTELVDSPVSLQTVRVIGFIGDGAEMILDTVTYGNLRTVPAPDGSTIATVAVEVRPQGFGEAFTNWLVFYDDIRKPPTADLIGKLCVLGLADETIVVKKLMPGQLPGRYNLLAMNGPPSYDVEIVWASKVEHMTQP